MGQGGGQAWGHGRCRLGSHPKSVEVKIAGRRKGGGEDRKVGGEVESIGIVEYSHDAQRLGCLRSLVVSKVLRLASSGGK